MADNKPTDTQTEMKVLAMVVRGDTAKSIAEEVGISEQTVAKIKKRNPDTLDMMKGKLATQQFNKATKILDRSHDLLDSKLSNAEYVIAKRKEARDKFENGNIDFKEFQEILKTLGPDVTISELTAVSREMFNQSQIEQGKPTSISGNSPEGEAQLKELVEAIKSGDMVALERIVFNPKPQEGNSPHEAIDNEPITVS